VGVSVGERNILDMVTTADVCRIANARPRTEQALVRDRIKFRIGRIVYASLSPEETLMGFGFPKEERVALIEAEPDVFSCRSVPTSATTGFVYELDRIDEQRLRELLIDAWLMVIPKRVGAAYLAELGQRHDRAGSTA